MHEHKRQDPGDRRVAWARRVAVLAVLAVTTSPVLAQSEPLRPPTPDDLAPAPTILTLLAALLIEGAVIFAATMPSKRGHQD